MPKCPNKDCGRVSEPGTHFCDGCGYDFETHKMPDGTYIPMLDESSVGGGSVKKVPKRSWWKNLSKPKKVLCVAIAIYGLLAIYAFFIGNRIIYWLNYDAEAYLDIQTIQSIYSVLQQINNVILTILFAPLAAVMIVIVFGAIALMLYVFFNSGSSKDSSKVHRSNPAPIDDAYFDKKIMYAGSKAEKIMDNIHKNDEDYKNYKEVIDPLGLVVPADKQDRYKKERRELTNRLVKEAKEERREWKYGK